MSENIDEIIARLKHGNADDQLIAHAQLFQEISKLQFMVQLLREIKARADDVYDYANDTGATAKIDVADLMNELEALCR